MQVSEHQETYWTNTTGMTH